MPMPFQEADIELAPSTPFAGESPPVSADELVAGPLANIAGTEDVRDVDQLMRTASPKKVADALAAYNEKRIAVRDWLESKMIEGTHYGYPPGTRPHIVIDSQDRECWKMRRKVKGKNGKNDSYEDVYVPLTEWRPKRSLYKAGGILVADLMNCATIPTADIDSWVMLGKPEKTVVFRVTLKSRATDRVLAEGLGGRKVPEYYQTDPVHFAITMAIKAGLAQAVLVGFGLADLFVQAKDSDEPGGDPQYKPEHPSPVENPDAPREVPRDLQITKDQLDKLFFLWRDYRRAINKPETVDEFFGFCHVVTQIPLNDGKVEPSDPLPKFNVIRFEQNWTRSKLDACVRAITSSPGFRPPGRNAGPENDDPELAG